ncbi:hypothetical protein LZ30DRAFT_684400 [Colletotrichum cereale]|nr:hypothetical protein LZ30DRAFT_684400 [Colletotrichum cereale]
MAEVIGIVASAAALIQLVRYGKKSAHALYGFSRRAGISKIDVERCANHVRTFSLTVGLAHEALEEYGTDPSASPVFEFISSRKVLSAISIDSESLVSRLTLAVKRFRGLAAGGRTPMAFIKWWLHKDDVMALFPEMERIKTNLMLIIAVIQLKMLYIKPKTEPSDSFGINKLEQRAKRLKSNIKTQLDTMAKLEEQIERAHQRRDSIGQQPPTAPVNLSYEALSQLGKSILNTGDVPSTPPASPGPSSPSSSTTGRLTAGLQACPIDIVGFSTSYTFPDQEYLRSFTPTP